MSPPSPVVVPSTPAGRLPFARTSLWMVARDAAIVAVLASLLALAVNTLRPRGRIPLVAGEPHAILVPCPEVRGRAEPLAPGALRPGEPGEVLLDGRTPEAFAAWHVPGARSLPFDYLAPVSPEQVKEVLKLRPQRVVVYGDGEDPDSGEQLARQIAGQGLRNVHFVRGGAPALRRLERKP